MKELSKSYKLGSLIFPEMTDLIKFLEKNGKYAVYVGGKMNGIYRYLEIIEATTTLTNSGQRSHSFWSFIFHQK